MAMAKFAKISQFKVLFILMIKLAWKYSKPVKSKNKAK